MRAFDAELLRLELGERAAGHVVEVEPPTPPTPIEQIEAWRLERHELADNR